MAMILRQFAAKQSKNVFTALMSRTIQEVPANKQIIPFTKLVARGGQPIPLILVTDSNILECNDRSLMFSSPIKRQIIDPLVNDSIREIFAPSIDANAFKVYQDSPLNIVKSISDPLLNEQEYVDPLLPGQPLIKEAVRMILVRRRKMRKHKLRKLRKKMRFVFEKIRLRRELRKEQAFRSELLTQVEDVQEFDAEKYVSDIIHKLRYYPKPETKEERKERYRLLTKKNKSNTVFIKPRFDC